MLTKCTRNDPKMNEETRGKCKRAMERGLRRFVTDG